MSTPNVGNLYKGGLLERQVQESCGLPLLCMQEDTMERSRLALRRARQRLSKATQQAKSNHWLVLTVFVFGMCLGVYFLSRLYRLGRFVMS